MSIDSINLNFDSVKNIYNNANKNVCNDAKRDKNPQAMVYGWQSCFYAQVKDTLETSGNSPMDRVYDWKVGCPLASKSERTTLEGRTMEQINVPSKPSKDEQCAEYCKAGITNLVRHNWEREQKGLPIIPLIFCYDVDGKKRVVTPGSIASRDPQSNKIITNKELRRCYKLCRELEKDPELKAIAEVAKKSIQFIKLAGSNSTEYKMEILHPFWESPEWEAKWKERIATKKPADPAKTILWREELKSSMASYKNKEISENAIKALNSTNSTTHKSNTLTADDLSILDSIGEFGDEFN
jgi:hypothetical protein